MSSRKGRTEKAKVTKGKPNGELLVPLSKMLPSLEVLFLYCIFLICQNKSLMQIMLYISP